MDHALDPALLRRRRAWLFASFVLAAAAVAALAWAVQRAVKPTLAATDIRVATVRRGAIANTISAAGVVIPVHEELVSSVVATRVTRVHARLGQTVAAGDLLLTLDDAAVRLALDAVKEQLAQQDNRITLLTLEMEQKRQQLVSAIELLELDLESASARLQRFNTLRKSGAVSGEDLLSAELNVKRAQIQLRQSRTAIEDGKRATSSGIDGARLQQAILRRQLGEQQRLLEQLQVRAPCAGIVSALVAEEGASVASGQLVAKVSEINNYRIEASLSDFHARAIEVDQHASVTQNGRRIEGRVQTILPEIQNGAIKLLITLAAPHDNQLRNKMRVDVDIVTASRANTLLVDAGEAFNGRGAQSAFVVEHGVAHKRTIEIGAGDGHAVEIVRGAQAGERLIVSSVARFKDQDSIRITP